MTMCRGIAGLLLAVQLVGCAGSEPAPPSAPPQASMPVAATASPAAGSPASSSPVPASPGSGTAPSGPSGLLTPPPQAPSDDRAAVATRIVVPALGVDLPVVSGDLKVPGAAAGLPLCDVAQYLPAYRQPAEAGTTYIYAHARQGMFLPLLEAADRSGGADLVGREVIVYTAAGRAYTYSIFEVVPNATSYALADRVRPGDQRLVLQTSTGPSGTVPKLQVGAELVSVAEVAVAEATPLAAPRACT